MQQPHNYVISFYLISYSWNKYLCHFIIIKWHWKLWNDLTRRLRTFCHPGLYAYRRPQKKSGLVKKNLKSENFNVRKCSNSKIPTTISAKYQNGSFTIIHSSLCSSCMHIDDQKKNEVSAEQIQELDPPQPIGITVQFESGVLVDSTLQFSEHWDWRSYLVRLQSY